MCELTGRSFVVTSGFRSSAYNRSVGGASNSVHSSGYAIDISVSAANRDDVFLAHRERALQASVSIARTCTLIVDRKKCGYQDMEAKLTLHAL
jgi:hypothetical protein